MKSHSIRARDQNVRISYIYPKDMSQGGTKHIENKYVGVTQKHEIIKGYGCRKGMFPGLRSAYVSHGTK